MTDLTTPEALARSLGAPTQWLVLLDFDGCLSPLVDEPDDAAPAPGAIAAIIALSKVTQVAIVSGRDVADLRRRLPAELPARLAGGHGAEIALPGQPPQPLIDVDQQVLDELADDLAAMVDLSAGWRLERKPASVALHHRMVEGDARNQIAATRARFEQSAHDGFTVLDGHEVTELRPTATDKGKVVDLLAAEFPELLPLSFGDDTTDEDAFEAAINHGGRAILVAEEPRATHATTRLTTPDQVVETLQLMATNPT